MRADWDLDRQVEQHVEIYRRLVAEGRPDGKQARGVFIPPDFPEAAGKAIQFRGNAKEFSLAELAELLVSAERLNVGVTEPKQGLVERIYDLKRLLPQPVKFPMKVVLGKLLNTLVEFKYRRYGGVRGTWAERRRQLDGRVLDYIREGGGISSIESDWSVADLARLLPKEHPAQRGHSTEEAKPLETSQVP